MRRMRVINYLDRLRHAITNSRDKLVLEELLSSYNKWKKSLSIIDFLNFMDIIQYKWKDVIMRLLKGYPQTLGQFRAFSFEEFIRDLIEQRILRASSNIRVGWNEKVLVWRRGNEEYYSAFDLVIYKSMEPIIVVEAKVDVDAPRLRAFLLNSLLLKRIYNRVYTVLVYLNWKADEILKWLAKDFIDEIFNFKRESEVKLFMDYIKSLISDLDVR